MIIDKLHMEVWMISLIGNHHADALRTVTIPKWQNEGFTINLFNAIIPDKIENLSNQLNFGLKHTLGKGIREFTNTEKAVWYSHLQLWEKCSIGNMTFLIIEEDTKPKKRFPNSIVVDRLYKISSAGSGYILRPITAKKMVKRALNKKLTYNVDSFISSFNDKDTIEYAMQVKREMRSISHN